MSTERSSPRIQPSTRTKDPTHGHRSPDPRQRSQRRQVKRPFDPQRKGAITQELTQAWYDGSGNRPARGRRERGLPPRGRLAEELDADGELEYAIIRRAALNSLRKERGADQQTAALSEHLRQVEAEFVAPERLDEAQVARLRVEAARRAMFDTSKEATLSRKYEAAAERGFYCALKELRELRKPTKGLNEEAKAEVFRKELGSILSQRARDSELDAMLDQLDAKYPDPTISTPKRGTPLPPSTRITSNEGAFDVPFAIGRAR
jgi:hypothetical protein